MKLKKSNQPLNRSGDRRGMHNVAEAHLPPPEADTYPPDVCTIGQALDLAFAMADEIIGSYHPDVMAEWREWLAQANGLIKDELADKRILAVKLSRV